MNQIFFWGLDHSHKQLMHATQMALLSRADVLVENAHIAMHSRNNRQSPGVLKRTNGRTWRVQLPVT